MGLQSRSSNDLNFLNDQTNISTTITTGSNSVNDEKQNNVYQDFKVSLKKFCNNSTILSTPIQRKLCNTNEKIVNVIAKSAASAIEDCQYQFRYRRWNCSIFNSTQVFGRLLGTSKCYSGWFEMRGCLCLKQNFFSCRKPRDCFYLRN